MRVYEGRKCEGYEIQTYNSQGNYSKVYGCDNLEEVALCLISICNGSARAYFPTIHLDGKLLRPSEINNKPIIVE